MNGRKLLLTALLLLQACATATYDPYVAALEHQLERRERQTREFENTDALDVMRAIVATLQDHHFRLLKVDVDFGVITAYQLTTHSIPGGLGGRSDITVLIRPRESGGTRVRAVMRTGVDNPSDPGLYQQFFAALTRRLTIAQQLN